MDERARVVDGDGADEASALSPAVRVRRSPPGTASGFFRRHRIPLVLAVIALCLYAGSILYILYGRGQIA